MTAVSQQIVAATEMPSRLRLAIRGAVQGVGFRPFVYRLATEMKLTGWVNNSPQGVFIEVEGAPQKLNAFLLRIEKERPPQAFIQSLESSFLDPKGYAEFEILPSDGSGEKCALVLPDIAVCRDCLREVFDPANRRYQYPFTNCTNCGPRFSIIEALPYDRSNTTMKKFAMCDECAAEYANPLDRRFHAQPNACPKCGPHLELWDRKGQTIASSHSSHSAHSAHSALQGAASAIRQGNIVAVKGLGGFHLMADVRNDNAIRELRQRKHREEKPLALMYPSLGAIRNDCEVSELEARLLLSPESPIVLLKRKAQTSNLESQLSNLIAPGNPYLGVVLPYTPLHHLLLAELNFPVVATSGNRSDEPICTDEHEALERLAGIAERFLVHDRPILRHVDDSIVRVMAGREMIMRRARGYAPLPIHLNQSSPAILATGAHLKNTVALSIGKDIFVSQHIGDLETEQAYDAFQRVIADFKHLYETEPSAIACDLHPDYLSTRFAQTDHHPVRRIQHHFAHVMACMAENEVESPALGVAWDGTGYGLDGTIWGGEFLRVADGGFHRAAHWRTFRLPGGDRAVKEPRRTALGLLYEIFGEGLFEMGDLPSMQAFNNQERETLRSMLAQGFNAPVTSSVGRLFDAAASIAGLQQKVKFEGQAAMELEFALDGLNSDESYPIQIAATANRQSPIIVDWEPMIRALLADVSLCLPSKRISAKFHNTLVESIVTVARLVGEERVCLTGGCFQNKYLTERTVRRLGEAGFGVYWHQRIPPNDGGISLGQAVAASQYIQSH